MKNYASEIYEFHPSWHTLPPWYVAQLIPFKWYQGLFLHFTHAKMSITNVVIEFWIGCDG